MFGELAHGVFQPLLADRAARVRPALLGQLQGQQAALEVLHVRHIGPVHHAEAAQALNAGATVAPPAGLLAPVTAEHATEPMERAPPPGPAIRH